MVHRAHVRPIDNDEGNSCCASCAAAADRR